MVYGVPDQSFVYSFVFMPVDVASRGDGHLVNFGVPTYQLVGKPPRRLQDNLQSANDGVDRLSVVAEGREIELGGESLDRVNVVDDVTQTLSRVLNLEGMDRVAQNVIAEQRLQSPTVHHVAGAIEEFVDVDLQRS